MQLEELLNLVSWEAMATPAALGLVIALVMVLFGKDLILSALETLWAIGHAGTPVPAELAERGAVINLVTFLIALGFSAWRLEGESFGPVMILALLGTVVAISSYETVKNLLRVINVDVRSFSLLGTRGK